MDGIIYLVGLVARSVHSCPSLTAHAMTPEKGPVFNAGPFVLPTTSRKVLRCPTCALMGVAFLSQQPHGMVVIDGFPVVFERVTSNMRYILLLSLQPGGASGY
jgi:hypothetical protein